MRNKQIWISKW